ncbi:prepilin-type N-terminal cleavage/methylation domain-containing protein [Blautia schinkii]|nr:prepilin-type N-terminal cleavage/methylation domain-containing protein [Blautia schinkii]
MLKRLNNLKKKNNKGFTLVELIIVIAILAILVGLLAPQYVKYVEKSRKSADVSNLDNLVTGIKVAAADHEYKLGGESGKTTTYTIAISDKGTVLLETDEKYTGEAAKAIKDYAEIDLSKATVAAPNSDLVTKSTKWGTAETATVTDATSEIYAVIKINNTTDAVEVEYSSNAEKYTKDGTIVEE